MLLFGKKKAEPKFKYDPNRHKAVIKCSICNGEQVAGFKDTQSGRFYEVMLIRNGQDLDSFMEMYELSSVTSPCDNVTVIETRIPLL